MCRNSDINWQNQKLHFGKNYIIIRLEYAYKVAIWYGVNNEEETKKRNTYEKKQSSLLFFCYKMATFSCFPEVMKEDL